MVRVATGLAERGLSTATFDFAYIAAGRKVPDRAPALESAWRDAMATGRSRFGGLPLYIGGKSMGGRIASHVAAQAGAGPLAGLVFLGYPLHPPGRPEQRRDAHLPAIAEPMLFVQGSRDAFGSGTEIRELAALAAECGTRGDRGRRSLVQSSRWSCAAGTGAVAHHGHGRRVGTTQRRTSHVNVARRTSHVRTWHVARST